MDVAVWGDTGEFVDTLTWRGPMDLEFVELSCGADPENFPEIMRGEIAATIVRLWFAKTSAESQNGAVLGGVGRRFSVRYSKKALEGANPRARGAHIYKRTGRKSIRATPLDCNDGAALRMCLAKT